MLLGGLVAAGCYVVNMMMQEHLVSCGLKAGWIGVPLLFISIFSMVGAALAGKTEQVQLKKLMIVGSLAAGLFIAVSSSTVIVISVFAAGMAHGAEEVLMLRIESENQKVFSSEIRATMVSVSSMMYSIFMVIVSPLTGWAVEKLSIETAFAGLGILVAGAGMILCRKPESSVDKHSRKL